jgi:hypothetical protein
MQQVYSHHDSSIVGLLNGILNESGIDTILKNWTGGNITEVPIPSLYPSIHVLDAANYEEAKQIIEEYLNHSNVEMPAWVCPHCGADVDGFLSECWSCQTPQADV